MKLIKTTAILTLLSLGAIASTTIKPVSAQTTEEIWSDDAINYEHWYNYYLEIDEGLNNCYACPGCASCDVNVNDLYEISPDDPFLPEQDVVEYDTTSQTKSNSK